LVPTAVIHSLRINIDPFSQNDDWNCLKEHRRLDDDCLGIEVHLSAASNCIAIKNLGATPICISTHQRQ